MFQPLFIITLVIVLARVAAAALLARQRRNRRHFGQLQQATQLPRLQQIAVEATAGVVDDEGRWAGGRPWRIDIAGTLAIGGVDGDESDLFGRVSGLVISMDGSIHVADDQSKDVRVFSASGEFVERYGRDGEGPGEFRTISGLGRTPNGGIAAVDGSLGRLTRFGPQGEVEGQFRLERPYTIIRYGQAVRIDRGGRYHDIVPLAAGAGARDSSGLVRYDVDGAVLATLLLWVHDPERLTVSEGGRVRAALSIPFAPRPSAAIDGDGRIYTSMGETYRITVRDPSGDTVRVIRREVSPVAIDPVVRDSVADQLGDTYLQVAGSPLRQKPRIAEWMPAIAALQVDEEDHLWVLRPTGDPTTMEWDIFMPDGMYLGMLQHPLMHVMHISEGAIAGLAFDEFDVPSIRIIPLARN